MARLNDLAAEEFGQSVLIFGAPKTGKTWLASTLAQEGYNIIWIDCEKGSQTLKSSIPPEFQKQVDLFRIDDSRERPNAITTVIKLMSMRPQNICTAHGVIGCAPCSAQKKPELFETLDFSKLTKNDVVVFDSLTQISDSAMNNATADLTDFAKIEFKHYDKQGILLSMFLSAIQNFNHFHRIVISHEASLEMPDKTEKLIPVGGTKNFSRKIAKNFDHVIYARVFNNKHQYASSTGFNMRILTGSRSNLAMETGNVTLGDLLKAKPIIGGNSSDLTEDEKGETVVTTNKLLSQLKK